MNFDINQTFQYVGFLSEKSVRYIQDFLLKVLPEATAKKSSVIIYWISLLLVVWLFIAIAKKLNPIIKIILIVLISLLAIGFFLPNWQL